MESNHLLKGEIFTIDNKNNENEKKNISDQEINDKYRKGEMRIVTEQGRINLDSIVTLLESTTNGKNKYILNPEYQRRKRWTNKQKSLLIESFIINVPIPPIFLYEVQYAIYEVMDGLQRLTAIYDFYKEKFTLEGLEYWKELEGKKYSELPENVKAGIDRRYLSSIILLEETAKDEKKAEELKQIVFERLNSGGEKLTPQETRNALHNGPFNQMCIKLAENDNFRKMWNFPLENEVENFLLKSEDDLRETNYNINDIKSYRKMDDVELVLRFFAYRHIDKMTSPVEKFLDKYLKQANNFSTETIEDLKILFIETINLIYEILGNEAFTLPKNQKSKEYKSPTKTMYDAMMQSFAKNIQHKSTLLEKADDIKNELYNKKEIYKNGKYIFESRNNNRNDVIPRIKYFDDFLQKFIQ